MYHQAEKEGSQEGVLRSSGYWVRTKGKKMTAFHVRPKTSLF